ncbi:unannotated protein [freshwater metagenome]|uniref:Unannotated protein n=1 Tax=freshwater metagenome TaxID=449393 RepID=A0A6J7D9V3_9ZZZZ
MGFKNVKFCLKVGTNRVVGRQFLRDLLGGNRTQALVFINCLQFSEFNLGLLN